MESNKKMKITITAIILVVIVAFAIIIGIIVSNIQKENRRKELINKYGNNNTNNNNTNINNDRYNTNNDNTNTTNNTTTNVTNSNKELLPEPIVLFNKDNITVKVTKMEYTNSSWTGEFLDVTFEMDNQSDTDLTFRVINIPKLNGWSATTRFTNRNISANDKREFEISIDTKGIIDNKKEDIKELNFDFTLSTQSNFMENKEEEVLYTAKNNIIHTIYYDNAITNPIVQNENVGINLYEVPNLKVRANLEKTQNGGNLNLIMINKGYTSPEPVGNRGNIPEKTNDNSVRYATQSFVTGDIDSTYLTIKKLKINGIEIGQGFESSIYGELLTTIGNTAAIKKIDINLKSETLNHYGIETIQQIELSGQVYKEEMYANKVVVLTRIGEFNDIIVK